MLAMEMQQCVLCFYHTVSKMVQFLEKNVLHIKRVLISLQLLSTIFLILGKIQGDIITNVHRSSHRVPIVLVRF